MSLCCSYHPAHTRACARVCSRATAPLIDTQTKIRYCHSHTHTHTHTTRTHTHVRAGWRARVSAAHVHTHTSGPNGRIFKYFYVPSKLHRRGGGPGWGACGDPTPTLASRVLQQQRGSLLLPTQPLFFLTLTNLAANQRGMGSWRPVTPRTRLKHSPMPRIAPPRKYAPLTRDSTAQRSHRGIA